MTNIEADYLVIGSGAVSMAFVDTMLDETDATFVMIDRHHMPGGHWNDAYPFVRLHQPSAFYGVASSPLGSNRIDEAGPNEGYYELASGAEVSAYFDKIMRERFLPSGRVQYFPMCDYVASDSSGNGRFQSLVSSAEHDVVVAKKTVDGTFFNTSVPSTHQRKFTVAADVECIAPNELPRRAAGYRRFCILGGGKTGMDTGVWLLEAGVDPGAISWVCPRDSWLINRSTTQPGAKFAKQSGGSFLAQLDAIAASSSVDELFERFEAAGVMLRINPDVRPSMFHYATISQGEVAQLQRIDNVLRQGHVARISKDGLTMESGEEIETAADTLYIDCTATAVEFVGARTVPVFSDDRITLQALLAPLVTTSAAITAFVEAHGDDTADKNRLCTPVQLADTPVEWMHSFMGNAMNQNQWSQHAALRKWFATCRLNPSRVLPEDAALAEQNGAAAAAFRERLGQSMGPAMANLQKLMAGQAS